MTEHTKKLKSGYSYARSQQQSSWIGRTSDHTTLREWYISKLLYPKMTLRNTWTVPPFESDDMSMEEDTSGFISDMAFSRGGRKLVAGCTNKNLYVFEPNTGKSRAVIRGAHNNPITRVCFVSETQFVSGSVNGTIALWDIRKSVQSINVLSGHTKSIRSLNYDYDEGLLISSSFDGNVRYWHIPSLQVERSTADNQETESYRCVLFSCPNLNQVCFYDGNHSKKLACVNSYGTLFVLDNLNLHKLKDDMHGLRLDDSLNLQLSWFTPNADPTKRNRISIVPSEDYCPDVRAKVSKVHFATFHPSFPLVLLRLVTSKRIGMQQETKDWSCLCRLQHSLSDENVANYYTSAHGFASDILEEKLLYAEEETRFASLREKRPSFSKCGRIIASPDKRGVRLLGFSEELNTPLDSYQKKKTVPSPSAGWMSSLFSAEFWPTASSHLTTVSHLERAVDSVTCARFSPQDMLLAVGDTNEQVSFYQPAI